MSDEIVFEEGNDWMMITKMKHCGFLFHIKEGEEETAYAIPHQKIQHLHSFLGKHIEQQLKQKEQ